MTRRIVERTFDPKKPLLVRRAFSAAGRTFQPGDSFEWKRLSVAQRRVTQMFDAGHLMHEDDQSSEETETQTQTQTVPPAPPADNSDLDVDSLVVLQAIAQREGAPLKTTKAGQRQAIIEHRASQVS